MRHLAAIVLLFTLHCARAQPLVLLTEEYPPFNMSDAKGRLTGISTDVVRELMREADIPYRMAVSPWMRAMTLAHTQADHCVFSMSRLAERERQYRWIGPIAYNDWMLFARTPLQHVPRSLEEVKGARIGSYFGDGGVDYLKQRGFDVDVAPRDDLNPRKLQLGRIDYWAAGKLSGEYLLRAQHLEDIEPVLKLERGDMYLACNLALPDATEERLRTALAALVKRGVIARIYATYGYAP